MNPKQPNIEQRTFTTLVTTPPSVPKGIHIEYNHHFYHFFIQANTTIQDDQQNTQVSIQFGDPTNGTYIARVHPTDTKKIEPFVVSAKTTLELLNLVEDARYLQMTGVLEYGYLIAQNLEPMRLEIPEHWKKWIPPMKRKVILEDDSSNDNTLELGVGNRE